MKVKFIGISGQSGSGKSEYSKYLLSQYNTPLYPIQMDWFFKEPRKGIIEDPESIDIKLFLTELKNIKEQFENGFVNNKINTPSGLVEIKINSFNYNNDVYLIIEGFLLFCWKEIVDLCDEKFYIKSSYEICRDRRYFRDYSHINNEEHKKEYNNWYENVVYKYFLIYQEKQMCNLNNSFITINN
jgi:hypothetical protein